MRSDSDVTIF